jgi:hypothetical protein
MLSLLKVNNVEVLRMAFCKSCGTEIGEAKFCPACGTAQDVIPVVPVQETVSEPIFAPVFTPAPTAETVSGDASGSASAQVPPVYTAPVYSANVPEKLNTTGQTVFSVINIALGVIFCCCSGVSIISMVLGIIALVFSSQAGKAATMEEGQQKLRSAKIMNIVGVVFLGIAVIVTIIIIAVSGTSTWTDMINNYKNNY